METVIDTEQFRNVQESERYGIHVSGTKKTKTKPALLDPLVYILFDKQCL